MEGKPRKKEETKKSMETVRDKKKINGKLQNIRRKFRKGNEITEKQENGKKNKEKRGSKEKYEISEGLNKDKWKCIEYQRKIQKEK